MALEFAHGAIQWVTSDALSTVYTISGLAFQPKAIRFYQVGIQNAGNTENVSLHMRRGIGFAVDTSNRRCVGSSSQDASGSSDCATAYATDCVVIEVNAAGTVTGKLDLNSITSDGFTCIVDDVPAQSLTVFWEAWGGSDITVAAVGTINEPTATGTQDYAVTGFTSDGADQVVMFAGVQSTAAAGSGQATDSGMTVGFATGTASANQIVVTGNSDDSSANMDTDGYSRSGECLAMIVLAGGNPNARASLSAWGTDLFTLNWAARAISNRHNIFMAIKGGKWQAGGYSINGQSSGNQATVSGLPFTLVGASFLGAKRAENAAGTASAGDNMGIGTATGTGSQRTQGVHDADGIGTSEIVTAIRYDAMLSLPTTCRYAIVTWGTSSFVVECVNTSGVAAEWQGYLAFGNVVPQTPFAPLYQRKPITLRI